MRILRKEEGKEMSFSLYAFSNLSIYLTRKGKGNFFLSQCFLESIDILVRIWRKDNESFLRRNRFIFPSWRFETRVPEEEDDLEEWIWREDISGCFRGGGGRWKRNVAAIVEASCQPRLPPSSVAFPCCQSHPGSPLRTRWPTWAQPLRARREPIAVSNVYSISLTSRS